MPQPNFTDLKKLDEDTLQKLTEGSGPADECLCSILAPPPTASGKGGIRASIKKAIGGLSSSGRGHRRSPGRADGNMRSGNEVNIPLYGNTDGNGWAVTKEVVERKSPCGRCGCDKEKFVLKHAYANIKITTPDISNLCPCPGSKCVPGMEKLNDNIQITVEQLTCQQDPDLVDSENDLYGFFKAQEQKPPEPNLARDKRSVTSLIEDAYDDEYKSGFYKTEDFDNWSDEESNK